MKNFLIVNAVYHPEPVVSAQIAKDLAENLADNMHQVAVIAPYPSRPHGFKFDDDLKLADTISHRCVNKYLDIYRLPSYTFASSNPVGRLLESMSFGWHSYKFIKKSKADKVYMNTWPIFGQFGVAKACVKMKIPYIVHIQDIYPESLTNKLPKSLRGIVRGLLMPFENYTLKHAAKIIVISQNMRSYILKNREYVHDKIELVYNWQTDEPLNKREVAPIASQPKFTFTYLGNIGPVAGVEFLIKAFQQANLTDCCLTIAGGGSKKQACVDLAVKTPHLDIKFLDVPVGKVSEIQSGANVLLLSVIKGGALSSIPSKLPAYMLSAKPILAIVDKGSDTALAIEAANCGWVGNAEDVNWLAESMKRVISYNLNELSTMGENGRDYCLNNFSKRANLEKLTNSILND